MALRTFALLICALLSFNLDAQKKITPKPKASTPTKSTKKTPITPKTEEVKLDRSEKNDVGVDVAEPMEQEMEYDRKGDDIYPEAPPPPSEDRTYNQGSYGQGSIDGYPTSRYRYDRITDNISYITDKLSDEYNRKGLLKGNRLILPIIFSFHDSYYSETVRENKTIIAGIGNNLGLYNYDTEKWVIPMTYRSLSDLGNGLYLAGKSDKMGVIDRDQNVVIPFDWQYIAKSSIDNYYIVTDTKNKRGLLNIITKKLSIPCIYSELEQQYQSNNFTVVEGTLRNFISADNKPLFKTWYEELHLLSNRRNIIAKKNGLYGIINENEEIVLPFEYTFMKSYPYNDGSHLARNKAGKYGCIASDGRVTLPFEYDKMDESYSGNLLSSKNNKCGIVQVNQGLPTEIVTCDYDDIKAKNNYFVIQKGGKQGILDNFGKTIVAPSYDNIEIINASEYEYNNRTLLFIAKKGTTSEILNNIGQKIGTNTYKSVSHLAQLNDYGGIRKIIGLKYTDDKNKVGVLDLAGQQILAPLYEDITFVEGSYIGFRKGTKFGVYNYIQGKEIMAAEYDQIVHHKSMYIGNKGSDFYQLNLSDPSKNVKL
jgi:hypothetical protein